MSSAQLHLDALFQDAARYPRELSVRRGIDFCSNDYLSLKTHPRIQEKLRAFFADDQPLCSTGSRLVSGQTFAIEKLEQTFANFVQRPRALFFGSGYQANLAVIAMLVSGCAIFSDELNHASIIDGIRLVRDGDKERYQHNDFDHLEALLKRPTRKPKAIITESLFSTNGTTADVAALDYLAKKYDALLLVDESHATGAMGSDGRGILASLPVISDHIISTHSCGKALASFGAFVAASEKVASILRNQCRQFICTTAPPPYLVAHVQAVLEVLEEEPQHRSALKANIAQARGVLTTKVPVIAVPIGEEERALFIKNDLAKNGIDVAVFRYPSVKKNHAQLRITLHSANTVHELRYLHEKLEALL